MTAHLQNSDSTSQGYLLSASAGSYDDVKLTLKYAVGEYAQSTASERTTFGLVLRISEDKTQYLHGYVEANDIASNAPDTSVGAHGISLYLRAYDDGDIAFGEDNSYGGVFASYVANLTSNFEPVNSTTEVADGLYFRWVPNTYYWLVMRVVGSRVDIEHWDSDPTLGGNARLRGTVTSPDGTTNDFLNDITGGVGIGRWVNHPSGSGVVDFQIESLTVTPGTAPSAAFTSSVNYATVTFDPAASTGTGLVYSWDFGEVGGLISKYTSGSVSHEYSVQDEAFDVTLTVIDNVGRVSTVTHSVTPLSPPSIDAGFTYEILPPSAAISETHTGLVYNFDGSGSIDGSSFVWDFGDGGTSTELFPSHTYSAYDDYTVTLTVSNDEGSDTATYNIVNPATIVHSGKLWYSSYFFHDSTYGPGIAKTPHIYNYGYNSGVPVFYFDNAPYLFSVSSNGKAAWVGLTGTYPDYQQVIMYWDGSSSTAQTVFTHPYVGTQSPIHTVAISPDGTQLAWFESDYSDPPTVSSGGYTWTDKIRWYNSNTLTTSDLVRFEANSGALHTFSQYAWAGNGTVTFMESNTIYKVNTSSGPVVVNSSSITFSSEYNTTLIPISTDRVPDVFGGVFASHDGTKLAFTSNSSRLYTLPISGGTTTQAGTETVHDTYNIIWSPSDDYLVYGTGTSTIYKSVKLSDNTIIPLTDSFTPQGWTAA